MSSLKNQLKTALKILLTGGALYLVFQKIDTAQLLQLSKNLSWPWLLPAIALFVGSKVATAIRLNHYFANIHLLLSAWENWRLYLIGMFYNLFLPGGIGGDGYKVYLLNKDFKTPVKELLKASLLDRLGGLVAIVALLLALLGLIELPWQGFATWTSKALLLAVFAEQSDALPPALARAGGTVATADADLAGLHGIQSEQGAQELGATGADDAGNPDHLATAQGQAGIGGLGGSGEVLDL